MVLISEEKCMLAEDGQSSDNRIIRRVRINLVCLCVIFLFSFTAFSGLQNLENSVNPGIGIYSLAIITGGGFISCVFAPTIIAFISAKGALALSAVCLAIFVASNFHPKDYFLLPGAAVYGLSSGVLWTSQGSYIATISMQYAEATGQSFENVISRFVGIFCMAFQSSQIWGNIISSVVLQTGNGSQAGESNVRCGANFCPADLEIANGSQPHTTDSVDNHTLHVLLSVYLGCTCIAFIAAAFLLKKIPSRLSGNQIPLSQLLIATIRLPFQHLNMALIIPLALYSGMEQVVMYAEFTRAYIACEIGLEWIGYSMISFGVVNTIASPTAGLMVKYIGRPVLIIVAAIINVGLLLLLRFWDPTKEQFAVFFLVPALWGFADAIWQTQNSALVGYSFPEDQEPAYANLRLWEALGFMIPYLYSNSLCVTPKLYIVGIMLILTLASVMAVEYRIRQHGTRYKMLPSEET